MDDWIQNLWYIGIMEYNTIWLLKLKKEKDADFINKMDVTYTAVLSESCKKCKYCTFSQICNNSYALQKV